MSRTKKELAGEVFGAWTVMRRIVGAFPSTWLCQCDCGTERIVNQGNLLRGGSTNCGCVAYLNRQRGRNLAPTERDVSLPNEMWKELFWREVSIEASTYGRVRHKDTGHVYSPFTDKNGYPRISVGGKLVRLHRVVATAFHANPLGFPLVNHKDLNKGNSAPDNLEWCTHLQNSHHAWENGAYASLPGSANPAAKLTEEQVIEIRNRYATKAVSQSTLAREFGVSQRAISLIARREKWTHV